MRACVLLVTLLSLPAVSQTIIGTVEKIDKDQLQVKGQNGMVTLHVDEKTTVQKVKTSHDLSPLTVGDWVRLTYYGEGALTAVNVSTQVTLSGVITEASSAHLTVVPNSTADMKSSDTKAAVFVFLSRTTQFGASRNQNNSRS